MYSLSWSEEGTCRFRTLETGVAAVTSIRCRGLEDVAQKSESLCFHGLSLTQLPHKTRLCVQGDRTRGNEYLMYLGITLYGRFNFNARLSRLSLRVMVRLFKNIGRPNKVICRHYTCVTGSVTLYGISI